MPLSLQEILAGLGPGNTIAGLDQFGRRLPAGQSPFLANRAQLVTPSGSLDIGGMVLQELLSEFLTNPSRFNALTGIAGSPESALRGVLRRPDPRVAQPGANVIERVPSPPGGETRSVGIGPGGVKRFDNLPPLAPGGIDWSEYARRTGRSQPPANPYDPNDPRNNQVALGAHGDENPGDVINRILDDLRRISAAGGEDVSGQLGTGFNQILDLLRQHRGQFPLIRGIPQTNTQLTQEQFDALGGFLAGREQGLGLDEQVRMFNDLLQSVGANPVVNDGGGNGNGGGRDEEGGGGGGNGGGTNVPGGAFSDFFNQFSNQFQDRGDIASLVANFLGIPLGAALTQQFMTGNLSNFEPVSNALQNLITSGLFTPGNIDAFIAAQGGTPTGGAAPLMDAGIAAQLRTLAPTGSEFLLGNVIPELTERARRTDSLQALAGLLGGGAQGANVQGALNAILSPRGGLPGQAQVAGLIPQQLNRGAFQQNMATQLANFLTLNQTPLQGDIVRGFQQMQQRGQPTVPQIGPPGISAPTTFEQLRGLANFNVPGVTAPAVAAERVNIPGAAGISPVAQPRLTGEVGSQISRMLQGGGLTPEFVQAQRNLVLEPSRQQLQGQFNQSVQGAATAQSGLLGELQRRQERDFNDQLIRQGFENFQNTLGLGLSQAGQEAQTGFANQQALQRQQEFGVNTALQQALANQQAMLEAARLGGGFGLTAQQANVQAALQRPQVAGDVLGRLAGFETGIAQQSPQLALQAALANQAAQQRAGEFGGTLGLQQLGVGADIQRQLAQQAIQTAQLQSGLAQQALGTGLGAFGAIPQAAFPFLQLAGNLPIEQTRALTPVAELLGTLPIQQAQLAGQLGTSLRGLELQALEPNLRQQQLLQQNLFDRLNLGQQFLQGQQQFGLGTSDIASRLVGALLSGQFQERIAGIGQAGQQGAARAGALGAAIPAILGTQIPKKGGGSQTILAAIIGALGGLFGSAGAKPPPPTKPEQNV